MIKPKSGVSPGQKLPKDMNSREWSAWISDNGVQGSDRVNTFTPIWTGFSTDPVGDLSYMDFGAIVMVWTADSLQGTSDDSIMSFSGLPESIRPSGIRMTAANYLVDMSGNRQGTARVHPSGVVDFWINLVVDDGAGFMYVAPELGWFHNTSGKGLGPGWLIQYAK